MAKWGDRDAALPSSACLYEMPKPQVVWSTGFPARRYPHIFLSCREGKRFLAFARNDEGGEQHSCIKSHLHGESVKRHSPSFPWKEVARRGGGWHRSGMKVVWGEHCLVSSSRAEPRDLFRLRVSFFLCESVCMKHRSVQFIWSMAFPVIRCSRILGLTANGKDFSLSLEMTIWGKRYSPFSSLVPSP